MPPINAPHKSAAYKAIPPFFIFFVRGDKIAKQVPTHKPQMVFNENENIITSDGEVGHGRNVIIHRVTHKMTVAAGKIPLPPLEKGDCMLMDAVLSIK